MQAGALVGALSVKCPRCRAFNHLRPSSPNPERLSAPDPFGAKT
ncbi:zinc finger domain-containing protein [Cypionkella sp. TWP1-2-1b2]